MNCPKCGSQLSADAKFCGVCGAQLGAGAAQPTTAQAVSGQTQTPTPRSNYNVPQSQAYQQQSYAQAYAGVPAAPQKGALGQAWSDITGSKSWFPRILLLIVMNCVPILSFYVSGYMLQWGADASRGKNPELPRGTFDKSCFLTGLFYSLLCFCMVLGIIGLGSLNFIPILGTILLFVAAMFASAFTMLAAMRMALYRKLGKAFDLSELFVKYKKALGSLFAASIVPFIAFGVCVFILVLLLVLGGGAFWSPYAYDPYSMMYSSSALSNALIGGITGIILIVLMVLLCIFFYGFAEVWAMRAVGVWVARNCPDWAQEAQELEAKSLE